MTHIEKLERKALIASYEDPSINPTNICDALPEPNFEHMYKVHSMTNEGLIIKAPNSIIPVRDSYTRKDDDIVRINELFRKIEGDIESYKEITNLSPLDKDYRIENEPFDLITVCIFTVLGLIVKAIIILELLGINLQL